jgi:hypothetical protein
MKNLEKLAQINKNILIRINEEFYVATSDKGNLFKDVSSIPIYFVELWKGEVLHDTPCLGATSIGDTTRRIVGPFSSKQDAEEIIDKERKLINNISYDFSGKVRIILIPESDFSKLEEVKIHKYYRKIEKISANQFSPKVFKFNNLLKQFYEILSDELKKRSEIKIEEKGKIIALIDNCAVETKFYEAGFGASDVAIETLSNKGNGFPYHDLLNSLLRNNGFSAYYDRQERHIGHEYISFEPINIPLQVKKGKSITKIVEKLEQGLKIKL